jgi:predicted nucleic acid-binding protein
MKHAFLDTNILVDLVLETRPSHKYAEQIIRAVQTGRLLAYASTQSLLDLSYILTRGCKTKISEIGKLMQKFSNTLIICDTVKHFISLAAAHYTNNFEDAVLAATAMDAYCDVIVTGDKTFDDPFGPPIVSPDEFCREFFEEYD